ncbi:ribosome maturation factor RimM [Granulosicoccaceae sp. 1_MG-2023]|nr:ribosome maturation factor RimM [Granulosicoccaceae sp. 1_MG-2023]
MQVDDDKLVPLGRISGVFGLQGWVKVFSDTDPREQIVTYRQWLLLKGSDQQSVRVLRGKRQGKSIVAHLEGVDDRTAAEALIGRTIAVYRSQLPVLPEDEYYWSDLVGLEVVTTEAVVLGKVDHLFQTGANDVMSVKGERERLVPWIRDQVIKQVDLATGCITVDWDPDF